MENNTLSSPGEEKFSAEWDPAHEDDGHVENGIAESPPDASSTELKSPPAKRRREEKERSRVSRACDRCKK